MQLSKIQKEHTDIKALCKMPRVTTNPSSADQMDLITLLLLR